MAYKKLTSRGFAMHEVGEGRTCPLMSAGHHPTSQLFLTPSVNIHTRTRCIYLFMHAPNSVCLQCRELDSLPAAARGPLYGIPFGVKDNIDVAGLPTTAACEAYRYIPTESAPTVEALLNAGEPSYTAESSLACLATDQDVPPHVCMPTSAACLFLKPPCSALCKCHETT